MIGVRFDGPLSIEGKKTGRVAVINGWQWASNDKAFEAALNADLDPQGPGGEVPDPDMQAAQAAIKRWGGKIIIHEPRPYPPKDAKL